MNCKRSSESPRSRSAAENREIAELAHFESLVAEGSEFFAGALAEFFLNTYAVVRGVHVQRSQLVTELSDAWLFLGAAGKARIAAVRQPFY